MAQITPAKYFFALLACTSLAISMNEALGQVYRCTTPEGQTVFSDRPCATDARIHELPAVRQSSPPIQDQGSADRRRTPTQAEILYQQDREKKRREAQERQQRIRNADDRVRQIRSENYDPEKCATARARIANYQRRDPIGASYSIDVIEWRQKENLYCGHNRQLDRFVQTQTGTLKTHQPAAQNKLVRAVAV